jgi:hypothetical protein
MPGRELGAIYKPMVSREQRKVVVPFVPVAAYVIRKDQCAYVLRPLSNKQHQVRCAAAAYAAASELAML